MYLFLNLMTDAKRCEEMRVKRSLSKVAEKPSYGQTESRPIQSPTVCFSLKFKNGDGVFP